MGLNFRKSINLGKGFKLNIGKKSVGISGGVKGARVSLSSSGRKTATFSIPGTGLSYSVNLNNLFKGKSSKKKSSGNDNDKDNDNDVEININLILVLIIVILLAVIGVAAYAWFNGLI
ncbi:MAG: DUF4236 domain-containing protein [Roseburia sp.]|nr:DUF4236 domain-containing protein [Roseburia sp.]